jgi:hypothetical protein
MTVRRDTKSGGIPKTIFHQLLTKGNPMRSTIRYQSQLLFRKSYKPNRVIRIRPAQRLNLVFRPTRAGPQIKTGPNQMAVVLLNATSPLSISARRNFNEPGTIKVYQ